MRVQLSSDHSVTLVENAFIDCYMAAANGEFVKVYLYLLRLSGAGAEISISSIADFFDHTEKDVLRALCYWEKQGLLRLVRDAEDQIMETCFLPCIRSQDSSAAELSAPVRSDPTAEQSASASAVPASAASAPAVSIPAVSAPTVSEGAEVSQPQIPPRSTITPARRRELKEQMDFRQLIFVAETYFGRPLTPTELNTFLYFYDGLKFSCELIEYLVEYCVSKGETGTRTRYMEKIALDWYRKNITTVSAAKEEGASMHGQYRQILGFLGITGRNPVDPEKDMMDRWTKSWCFDLALIQEACTRTVMQTAQPSLKYADGILKKWHEQNVCTREDVLRLDEAHSRQKESNAKPQGTPSPAGPARSNPSRSPAVNNRFNTNFTQRSYDYAALQNQLLQAQGKD